MLIQCAVSINNSDIFLEKERKMGAICRQNLSDVIRERSLTVRAFTTAIYRTLTWWFKERKNVQYRDNAFF